jgi:hypothetical protein
MTRVQVFMGFLSHAAMGAFNDATALQGWLGSYDTN